MAGYTRQSTYTDGDIIDAADSNDEFDQLLAAFNASSGHTHDGTAAEGAAITKLLSNTLTFGAATSGTDITITFDGETNDGVLKWMEDEDYFEFSDDILVASTEKIQFRDTAIYINSSADGQLDLVADTEIQIAATTIDMNGAADISGNLAVGGNLTVAGNATVTGTTTFNGGTLTLGDSASDNVVFGADVDSHIIPDDDDTYDLGSSSQQWRNLYLDGSAYIDGLAEDILVATDKKVGFRDSAIYINSSADGQLDIVADTEIQIVATTIDIDGAINASGEIIAASLDISGNIDVDGTTNLDVVDIDGAVNIAAATTVATDNKIQFRDTGLYINSSTDGQLDIVADTEVQIAATTVDINGAVDVSGNLSVGGNLDVTGTFDLSDSNFTNAGDIQLDSITGDSDTNTSITFSGSDVITVTTGGETQVTFNNGSILPTTDNDVDLGSSSLEFKDLYIDGTAYVDAINFNGTAISATAAELNIMDGVTSTAAELNILDGVTSTAAELNILDGVTSTAAELNILDGVTATTAEINLIDGDTSRGTTAVASGDGILINDAGTMRMTNVDTVSTYFASHNVGGGNIVTTGALNSGSITSGFGAIDNGSSNITTTGVGSFGSLDISGAIDVDGTTNLDAVDIDGAVDMASTLQVTGVATLTATAIANAGVSVKNGATSAGFVEFFEDSDNGSNKVTLIGPASTADVTLTLPAAAGTVATTDDATALAIALG
tara:strand:+ start:1 stop:2172 length:2172 start_codon:yes stop_codon:yes gene_type:complete